MAVWREGVAKETANEALSSSLGTFLKLIWYTVYLYRCWKKMKIPSNVMFLCFMYFRLVILDINIRELHCVDLVRNVKTCGKYKSAEMETIFLSFRLLLKANFLEYVLFYIMTSASFSTKLLSV
jgi:hypothetical protein